MATYIEIFDIKYYREKNTALNGAKYKYSGYIYGTRRTITFNTPEEFYNKVYKRIPKHIIEFETNKRLEQNIKSLIISHNVLRLRIDQLVFNCLIHNVEYDSELVKELDDGLKQLNVFLLDLLYAEKYHPHNDNELIKHLREIGWYGE